MLPPPPTELGLYMSLTYPFLNKLKKKYMRKNIIFLVFSLCVICFSMLPCTDKQTTYWFAGIIHTKYWYLINWDMLESGFSFKVLNYWQNLLSCSRNLNQYLKTCFPFFVSSNLSSFYDPCDNFPLNFKFQSIINLHNMYDKTLINQQHNWTNSIVAWN